MTKSPETTPAPSPSEQAMQAFCENFVQAAWPPALRFVAELEGAPERCTRRACRRDGCCRLELEDGKPIECGGGVTKEMIISASSHAFFAALMAASHVEDVVIPERRELRARLWKEYGVPLDA
jgi:hypothetical protein